MFEVKRRKIIIVNVLIFVIWDLTESKKASQSEGHVIVTHLGLVPYDPVKEEDIFESEGREGGYFKAEIFPVPVNETNSPSFPAHFIDSNTTFTPDQNKLKNSYQRVNLNENAVTNQRDSATFPLSFSFQVGKSTTENAPRYSRRVDLKVKGRRMAKEDEEQISTGPIRITSGPNDNIKVDGYLKGQVITGSNRPTKLKIEDPPPGWKPLIKPNSFNLETKSKIKFNQDKTLDSLIDAKNRLGFNTPAGVPNQIPNNLDTASRFYPLRRNPYSKVYGYPSIVELPPVRDYSVQRQPFSLSPGYYYNYYSPGGRFGGKSAYYYNGYNQTGFVPHERFRSRYDQRVYGEPRFSFGTSSQAPKSRFGYASFYPTDFENDEFYTRIQSPEFDSKLDFPQVKFMDLKAGELAGGAAPFAAKIESRQFIADLKDANQGKNLFNMQRTIDTKENFGTNTEFYR